MKKYIIITTINPKTEGIALFEQKSDWNIVVIGDKKSKPIPSSSNLTFLSVEDQSELGYEFARLCPFNHYARKNIGYLYAIEHGAELIYDTDDDNLPYDTWGNLEFKSSYEYSSDERWINAYNYFTDSHIWPRGFPLDEINRNNNEQTVSKINPVDIGVWQGLADIDPDVDAIYRLVLNNEIKFEKKPPISIGKQRYCPFNSQNTFWNPKAYPFLYLPVKVSFRFTDILRSFVAQRLMWRCDLYLGFTEATVYQERNRHDLMNDFTDEVECYLNTKPITKLLDTLRLGENNLSNLEHVYQMMADHGFVPSDEVDILKAWISDLKRFI